MRRTYVIEVKCDFDDDAKYKAVEQMTKLAAQRLLIQANMLEDGRRPQVALRSEDYFLGTEELSINLPPPE